MGRTGILQLRHPIREIIECQEAEIEWMRTQPDAETLLGIQEDILVILEFVAEAVISETYAQESDNIS